MPSSIRAMASPPGGTAVQAYLSASACRTEIPSCDTGRGKDPNDVVADCHTPTSARWDSACRLVIPPGQGVSGARRLTAYSAPDRSAQFRYPHERTDIVICLGRGRRKAINCRYLPRGRHSLCRGWLKKSKALRRLRNLPRSEIQGYTLVSIRRYTGERQRERQVRQR